MASPEFDPASRNNAAKKNYEQTFEKRDLKSQEEDAVKQDDQSSQNKDVRSKEAAGTIRWKTNAKPGNTKKTPIKSRIKGTLRNKSAFVFIVVMLIGGLWYSSIFAPNLLLVNMKDLFSNDLADATTALSKYSIKMLDHKLGKADCSEEESIKCKLSTMSRSQVLAFKKNGFTVNGSKVREDNMDDRDPANDKEESRWKVNSLVFPDGGGTASDGQSYAKIASSSDHLRHVANNVWNPRSSFFMDARYQERIKTKFDLTKLPDVGGTSEKEVDESFDEAMQGDDEKIDLSGQGAYGLKTLASQEGQSALYKTATEIAKQPHSYINVQCGLFTQGKVVYNAAKKAKETSLARFAMIYLKAADQIKSGQLGVSGGEVTMNVLSSKLAYGSNGGFSGKNATDASMYRHIVLREPVKQSSNGMKYYADAFDSIGALLPATLQIMMTATATKSISGAPGNLSAPPADLASKPREYCLEGQKTSSKSSLKPNQCPALTMAAGAAPALASLTPGLAAIAALSDRICPPFPKGRWEMNPTASDTSRLVMPFVAGLFNSAVSSWADRVAKDFNHDTKGVAASDALFAGTGIILGDMAMSRGMQPASTTSLKTYLAEKAEADKEYEQLARYEARLNPFDAYNNYSFLGSLVRSFNISAQNDTLGTISNILAIIPASIAKTTSTASAIYNLQPAPLDTSRLQCPDAEYLNIGINADMGCNVRYSMGQRELDANVKNVLDYMLKAHPDQTRSNIQELQTRVSQTDAELDQAEVARQLSEAQEASNKPFIDKKTGAATKNSEYEKYLTYCVNREDPWGRTGLAVRKEELDEDEKEKRRLSKSPDGIQITKENAGSEYEKRQVSSYMAVTEGAKADQDWYTGKKCLENSEMLQNFRAYTMACSVDGSFAGSIDCTEADRSGSYTDAFYTGNDIFYVSWN